MSITDNIRSIREKSGLTQEALADLLKTTRSNYAYLENRGEKLTFEQIQNIANALGVTASDIIGIEAPKKSSVEIEKIRDLAKRVSELEDRLKDKEFRINSLEKSKFIFESLIFESLFVASGFSNQKKDYEKVLSDNPWLITLFSGIIFNGLSIQSPSWKHLFKKLTNKFIKKIEELERNRKDEGGPELFLTEKHFSINYSNTSQSEYQFIDLFDEQENDNNEEPETVTYYTYVDSTGYDMKKSYLPVELQSTKQGGGSLGDNLGDSVTP